MLLSRRVQNTRAPPRRLTRAMAANCTFAFADGSNVEDPALRAGLQALLEQLPPQLFSPGGLFQAARTDDVDAAR